MDPSNEISKITDAVASAMLWSTDSVTAAGAGQVADLAIDALDEAQHLARCIAAFTTDDALVGEMSAIVGESPLRMIGKVASFQPGLEGFHGPYAALEQRVWTRLYAGRRERSRVLRTLARRSAR